MFIHGLINTVKIMILIEEGVLKLVVSCRYDDIDVQIVQINNVETEKCFNGRTTIYGIINISSEDEDDFKAEFIYKGKSGEPKSRIIEYVKGIGIEAYKSKARKQGETLLEYVNSFNTK